MPVVKLKNGKFKVEGQKAEHDTRKEAMAQLIAIKASQGREKRKEQRSQLAEMRKKKQR